MFVVFAIKAKTKEKTKSAVRIVQNVSYLRSDMINDHHGLVVISFINDLFMRLIKFMYNSTLVIYFCINLT